MSLLSSFISSFLLFHLLVSSLLLSRLLFSCLFLSLFLCLFLCLSLCLSLSLSVSVFFLCLSLSLQELSNAYRDVTRTSAAHVTSADEPKKTAFIPATSPTVSSTMSALLAVRSSSSSRRISFAAAFAEISPERQHELVQPDHHKESEDPGGISRGLQVLLNEIETMTDELGHVIPYPRIQPSLRKWQAQQVVELHRMLAVFFPSSRPRHASSVVSSVTYLITYFTSCRIALRKSSPAKKTVALSCPTRTRRNGGHNRPR